MEIVDIESEITALRGALDVLKDRLNSGQETAHNAGEAFSKYLADRNLRSREEKGSAFALSVATVICQTGNHGTGTWSTIMTHGTADGLPSDQDLTERYARIQALATDPLTLPILRALLRLAFQGKRMQATAAELAAAIGRDTAAVEAALKPLVPVKLIQRRLAEDDTILYEWDGGDIAMIVLIAG